MFGRFIIYCDRAFTWTLKSLLSYTNISLLNPNIFFSYQELQLLLREVFWTGRVLKFHQDKLLRTNLNGF